MTTKLFFSAIVKFLLGVVLVGFIIASLGCRFGWYMLPKGGSIGAAAVFLIAYIHS